RRNSASAAAQKSIACQRGRRICILSPVVVLSVSVLLDITLITPTIACQQGKGKPHPYIFCHPWLGSLNMQERHQQGEGKPRPYSVRVGATGSRLSMSGLRIHRDFLSPGQGAHAPSSPHDKLGTWALFIHLRRTMDRDSRAGVAHWFDHR